MDVEIEPEDNSNTLPRQKSICFSLHIMSNQQKIVCEKFKKLSDI